MSCFFLKLFPPKLLKTKTTLSTMFSHLFSSDFHSIHNLSIWKRTCRTCSNIWQHFGSTKWQLQWSWDLVRKKQPYLGKRLTRWRFSPSCISNACLVNSLLPSRVWLPDLQGATSTPQSCSQNPIEELRPPKRKASKKTWLSGFVKNFRDASQTSNEERAPGCIGDYTAQLYENYNKPL